MSKFKVGDIIIRTGDDYEDVQYGKEYKIRKIYKNRVKIFSKETDTLLIEGSIFEYLSKFFIKKIYKPNLLKII